MALELVLLGFSGELTKLSEVTVDHDDVGGQVLLSVRHEDLAVIFGSVELVLEPEAGAIAFADLPSVVDNRNLMAGNS